MAYARDTTVSVDRSIAEITDTLRRYGADAFSHGWDAQQAYIAFRYKGKLVRFMVRMPDSRLFAKTPTGKARQRAAAQTAQEQEYRRRWRALALAIKAMLEMVESEITTFDEAFMAHLILPNNQTAGQYLLPQIDQAYETGSMPRGLLPPPADDVEIVEV